EGGGAGASEGRAGEGGRDPEGGRHRPGRRRGPSDHGNFADDHCGPPAQGREVSRGYLFPPTRWALWQPEHSVADRTRSTAPDFLSTSSCSAAMAAEVRFFQLFSSPTGGLYVASFWYSARSFLFSSSLLSASRTLKLSAPFSLWV